METLLHFDFFLFEKEFYFFILYLSLSSVRQIIFIDIHAYIMNKELQIFFYEFLFYWNFCCFLFFLSSFRLNEKKKYGRENKRCTYLPCFLFYSSYRLNEKKMEEKINGVLICLVFFFIRLFYLFAYSLRELFLSSCFEKFSK